VPEENFWTTVQGKINRDRHTDHPAGRHSIQTNHPPFFTGRMPFLPPTNSVKALKARSVNEQQNKIFVQPFMPATLFKLYQPPLKIQKALSVTYFNAINYVLQGICTTGLKSQV